MSIFQAKALADFTHFADHTAMLGILERAEPVSADAFFRTLTQTPFQASGLVTASQANDDVAAVVDDVLPDKLRHDPFCATWIEDMTEICQTVMAMLGTDTVDVRLDSHRGCRRYHIDNIPIRTTVTCFGAGTEYLPEGAADREAYANGASNAAIATGASRRLSPWDVSTFRGGPGGILHKTPDEALTAPSVFLRIDPPMPDLRRGSQQV